jgi:hypothetical protein
MQGWKRRWARGAMVSVAASMLLSGLAIGATPVRYADGQPGGDSQLSVLSPAEAAFMQKKRAMAAAVGASAGSFAKSSKRPVVMTACEFDPCEGDPSQPTWPPAGPSVAKTLGTKARQQKNYYYCGPAAGQVVINWTRGITSGTTNGEDPSTNWRTQTVIGVWMKTNILGTGGANLAGGLNNVNAVLKPRGDWVYAYDNNGSKDALLSKIVTDIDGFGMPLVLATAPHKNNAGAYYLRSWPNAFDDAHHWITLRGYDASAGMGNPVIRYQDSAGGYGGTTGSFDDALSVMWQVSYWNQGGHVVW